MPEHEWMIDTNDLRVGSIFSEPLFFDDGKHMFLASSLPLTQRLLDSLHEWHIPFVVTSGFELPDAVAGKDYGELPELESVD